MFQVNPFMDTINKKHPNISFSIGVDIESIKRFREIGIDQVKKKFHIFFLENELSYCQHKIDPYPSLTALFCAKEAVYKAFSASSIKCSLLFNEIEIIHNTSLIPEIKIHHDFFETYSVYLSISHTDDYAIAYCQLLVDNNE